MRTSRVPAQPANLDRIGRPKFENGIKTIVFDDEAPAAKPASSLLLAKPSFPVRRIVGARKPGKLSTPQKITSSLDGD
jgi:hypothetical protein